MSEWNVTHENFRIKHSVFTAPGAHMHTSLIILLREILYLSLHCHRHNDSCIKAGSDESHFNVSLIVSD